MKIVADNEVLGYFDGIVELGEDLEAEYEDLKKLVLNRAEAPIGAKAYVMSLSLL